MRSEAEKDEMAVQWRKEKPRSNRGRCRFPFDAALSSLQQQEMSDGPAGTRGRESRKRGDAEERWWSCGRDGSEERREEQQIVQNSSSNLIKGKASRRGRRVKSIRRGRIVLLSALSLDFFELLCTTTAGRTKARRC
jgi:hypothetical protein